MLANKEEKDKNFWGNSGVLNKYVSDVPAWVIIVPMTNNPGLAQINARARYSSTIMLITSEIWMPQLKVLFSNTQ
jgi:hypothetical protein